MNCLPFLVSKTWEAVHLSLLTWCPIHRTHSKYCANRFVDREMLKEFYVLQAVKSLRNACAHNSCILNNLRADRPLFKPSYVVTRELSTIVGIGLDQRKSERGWLPRVEGRLRDRGRYATCQLFRNASRRNEKELQAQEDQGEVREEE